MISSVFICSTSAAVPISFRNMYLSISLEQPVLLHYMSLCTFNMKIQRMLGITYEILHAIIILTSQQIPR